MQVDIYVREKIGTREIRIPILPEEIIFSNGDATGISYDVMELGEVVIPSGTELNSYSWKSTFPGKYRSNDSMIRGSWKEPKNYDSILRDWIQNGTELNLLVTGYPINADVYLKEYRSTASGAFGDIHYEIGFKEARHIVVTSTKVENTETTRPATTSSTYTIKSGDTLWGIARKFYGDGTKWKTIYDANKDIIEATAKKYGKNSSDNGHWIYPGVTLTIPGVSGNKQDTTPTPATTPTTTTAASLAVTTAVMQGITKAEQVKNEAYTSQRNQSVNAAVDRLSHSNGRFVAIAK